MTEETTLEFAWHVHHEDFLCEPLIESIETRREYISNYKDKSEQPLRLKLLKKVQGKLPEKLLKAGLAYDQAGLAYEQAGLAYKQARLAYEQARQAYQEAYKDSLPDIEALHKIECPDCPWQNGTIFTRKNEKGEWY